MKRRILIALTSVGLLVGVAAAPAMAAPYGPDRYQTTTNTYTLVLGYGHTYTVVFNPCDGGSVSATGWQWGANGDATVHNPDETVTATLSADGTMLTFNSEYIGGWGGSPYSWTGTFPVVGGTFTVTDSLGGVYENVVIDRVSSVPSEYKNHGEYVAAMGGGADAAHSCIGMPMKPADEATEVEGPDMAGLVAHLQAVIAHLQADTKANAKAVAAIQRHVDALNADDKSPGRPADVPAKEKPVKPALPDKAKGNPNPGNPGKP